MIIEVSKEEQARMDRAVNAFVSFAMRRFECVDGFPMYISQTGEEYIEFRCSDLSVEHVLCEIVSKFVKYARGKKGRLYWRIRPEIAKNGNDFCIYARLLISNKPVIEHILPKGLWRAPD